MMLVIPSLLLAQALDENIGLRQHMNDMFSEIEKNRISTGYLMDYAIDLIDFEDYDGTHLTDTNYVDAEIFELILRGLNSASVRSTSYIDVPSFIQNFSTPLVSNTVNIGIALFKYQRIKGNALNDNMIDYSLGKVHDVYNNGVWVNPYELADVIAFTPSSNICRTGVVSFNISSAFILKNQNFLQLKFDFGDGYGYRNINGGKVNVSYNQPGVKEIKMKVLLAGGKTLETHSKLVVVENNEPVPLSNVNPDIQEIVTCGDVSALVSFYYAPGHVSLEKPFIVAEGFDPWQIKSLIEDIDLEDATLGYTHHSSFYHEWNMYSDFDNDYDLIYIDWHDSFTDIHNNAELLVKIIENTINTRRSMNCEQSVLVGQSMGGLISRLALCDMESEGRMHKVGTFVSHDSPHLGANVPIGILYLLHHLACLIKGESEPVSLSVEDLNNMGYLGDFLNMLYSSQSVKQMLLNYVGRNGILCNDVHEEFQSELKEKGFPKGDDGNLQNLSIVNGSYYNYADVLHNNQYYLKIDGSLKFNGLMALVISIITKPSFVQDLADIIGIEGLMQIIDDAGSKRIDIQASAIPMIVNGGIVSRVNLTYTKKRLWKSDDVFDIYLGEGRGLGLTYDKYAGSTYDLSDFSSVDIGVDEWGTDAHLSIDLADAFTFIPRASALAINGDNLTSYEYIKDYYTYKPKPLEECPFDAYYLYDFAAEHININSRVYSWLRNQINIEIIGETFASDGEQYSISGYDGFVNWSVSDNSVAEIDQSGKLTLYQGGIITLTAECYNNGALIRTTKKIVAGIPSYALRYQYELGSGYVFTAFCVNEEDGHLVEPLIESGKLFFEWGLLEGDDPDADIVWTTSSDSTFTYLPCGENPVTIFIRMKTQDGLRGRTYNRTVSLYTPFEGNYKYIVMNKNKVLFFVTSDTYEVGVPEENYQISYIPDSSNPLFNSFINGPQDYIESPYNDIYIRFPDSPIEMVATKFSEGYIWSFDYFNTQYFLHKLESFMSLCPDVNDVGFDLYNNNGEAIQRILFPIVYKKDFPVQ